MSYFDFRYKDLADFIKKSKNSLEHSFEELSVEKHSIKNHKKSDAYYELINKLDNLSLKEFIIWSKEDDDFYRGIVIENCIFSNYKIIIEKTYENYKLALIKGVSDSRKVYCLSDISLNTVEMQNLICTIEMKLVQHLN